MKKHIQASVRSVIVGGAPLDANIASLCKKKMALRDLRQSQSSLCVVLFKCNWCSSQLIIDHQPLSSISYHMHYWEDEDATVFFTKPRITESHSYIWWCFQPTVWPNSVVCALCLTSSVERWRVWECHCLECCSRYFQIYIYIPIFPPSIFLSLNCLYLRSCTGKRSSLCSRIRLVIAYSLQCMHLRLLMQNTMIWVYIINFFLILRIRLANYSWWDPKRCPVTTRTRRPLRRSWTRKDSWKLVSHSVFLFYHSTFFIS